MMGFPRSAGYIPMLLRPLPWDGRKGLLMYIHSILGSKFKTLPTYTRAFYSVGGYVMESFE